MTFFIASIVAQLIFTNMEFSFNYNKSKVIQALRLHFVALREIKWMMVLVNVFVIFSAILLYLKKIRPEPFLLGALIWLIVLLSVWYIMPYSVYKKSETFKDKFTAWVNETTFRIENETGYVTWDWSQFSTFFESTHFFHLYFNKKSFFLLPKDDITDDLRHELRALLNEKLKRR